jgi:hypothetical protein
VPERFKGLLFELLQDLTRQAFAVLLRIDISGILANPDAQSPRCLKKAERNNLFAVAGQQGLLNGPVGNAFAEPGNLVIGYGLGNGVMFCGRGDFEKVAAVNRFDNQFLDGVGNGAVGP